MIIEDLFIIFTMLVIASMMYGFVPGIVASLTGITLGISELIYTTSNNYLFSTSHLSAIFIILVSVTYLITDLYMIRSKKTEYITFFLSFLSVIWIISAGNAIEFLIFWELMSLSGFFMIMEDNDTRNGYIYLSFSELSIISLTIGFVLNYSYTGSLMLNLFMPLPLFFIFTGLLIKLGIFPYILSEWAPRSYSAVTADRSSILAASMAAPSIYFMLYSSVHIQSMNVLLPLYLLTAAAISAVIASIYSAVSGNVKKVLGFSSIENNSLIVIAIALFMLFYLYNMKYISFIAFTAAIFLSISSIFSKSSMFLSTGYIQDKEHIILPAMSLMSLPIFAGYIGEFMLFETVFQAIFIKNQIIFIIVSLTGASIAICAGFSIIIYAKLYRFMTVMKGYESDKSKTSINYTVIYGVILLLVGLLSPFITVYIEQSVFPYGSVLPYAVTTILSTPFVILTGTPFGGISPLYEMLFLVIFFTTSIIAFNGFKMNTRVTETWNFGSENSTYTAEGYTNALTLMLESLFRTNERYTNIDNRLVYVSEISNPFWNFFILVGINYRKLSKWMSRNIMNGDTNLYISYILIIFVAGLILSYLS